MSAKFPSGVARSFLGHILCRLVVQVSFLLFQKKVKKPKSTKYVHHIVTTGTSAGQKVVTLTLDSPQEAPESVTSTPKASPSKTVIKSKSSSQLQGVWNDRFIPVPTPEKKGRVYCVPHKGKRSYLLIFDT